MGNVFCCNDEEDGLNVHPHSLTYGGGKRSLFLESPCPLSPPKLEGKSLLMSSVECLELRRHLPKRLQRMEWRKVYSFDTDKHSVKTLHQKLKGAENALLVLRINSGLIGAVISCGPSSSSSLGSWKQQKSWFGSSESFVFSILYQDAKDGSGTEYAMRHPFSVIPSSEFYHVKPEMESSINENGLVLATKDFLQIGRDHTLWIDSELASCHLNSSQIFGNLHRPLSGNSFVSDIVGVEAWKLENE